MDHLFNGDMTFESYELGDWPLLNGKINLKYKDEDICIYYLKNGELFCECPKLHNTNDDLWCEHLHYFWFGILQYDNDIHHNNKNKIAIPNCIVKEVHKVLIAMNEYRLARKKTEGMRNKFLNLQDEYESNSNNNSYYESDSLSSSNNESESESGNESNYESGSESDYSEEEIYAELIDFKEKIRDLNNDTCPICLVKLNKRSKVYFCQDCKKPVHQKCMDGSLENKKECVMCRSDLWKYMMQ